MAALSLTDPVFHSKAERNVVERFFLKLINDERDLPFIWLSLSITFVLIPLAATLYIPGFFRWWMAPIYWAVLFGFFFDRFILMLHNTSHRRLFKREYRFFNHWVPWICGPFCGESPETYYAHHITMHHSEGNMPGDLSSTMKYQRDSIPDFLKYFLRFFFLIIVDLTKYQLKRKRYPIIRKMLFGEFAFWALCAGLSFVSWQATFVVFVAPFLLCRFLMMAGNWGQHAFVDPDEPSNDYKSSITCINVRYNRRAFNDGYHISHHLVANRHWTDHPQELIDNRKVYADNDAIIFEGIDFFMVWAFLMLKRYDVLAKHFVDMRDEPRSKDEIIALLKKRVRRFENLQAA